MATTPTRDRKGLFILVTILILVVVTQAQNLFQYPYYQDAEGTYIANSWSLADKGELSPYTYAYEEAPVGSFLMAAWLKLSGGLSTFGFPVNSGRVLMLVLHLATIALVFGIAKKSARSDLAAAVAALVFAFSPLAIALQRKVLPENVMIVGLLFSLYLILGERRTLGHYLTSAIIFGLTALTKGLALFFLPAFLYIIHLKADPHHKRFATNLWLTLSIIVIAFYPLYANMKQELFPQGWLFGGNFPHVSLIERLMDRGPDTGRILNFANGLAQNFNVWVDTSKATADPILIYAGLIAVIFMIIMAIDNRNMRPILAMTISCAVYLCFGGQIFDSAAIILLPLLAINVGIVVGSFARFVGGITRQPVLRFGLMMAVMGILLYPFAVFNSNRLGIYTLNQVDGQIAAVDWVKANVSKDAVVVTDNYAFVELRQTLGNTHHYWQVDTDPAVKYTLLNDDVCSIDYVISTPQVYADINTFKLELMKKVMERSSVLMTYPNNGWPVEIRQTSKADCAPRTNKTVAALQPDQAKTTP